MKHLPNVFRLLSLAGVLGAIAWGCSTDSPTAPRQVPAQDDPTPARVFRVTITADPGGIVVNDQAETGSENTRIKVTVVDLTTGNPAPDGTLVQLSTSIGTFDLIVPTTLVPLATTNGSAFVTLFTGGPPVQRGIAVLTAVLGASRGQLEVPIEHLVADFRFNNPEQNFSVDFIQTARGNPTRFRWDFGDGTGATRENPVHEYDFPGTYNVSLKVFRTIAGVELMDEIVLPVVIPEPVEVAP